MPTGADLPSPRFFWAPPEGPSLLGSGAVGVLTGQGSHRFERIRRRATRWFDRLASREAPPEAPPSTRPRFFGGFGFFDEPRENTAAPFSGAYFLLPRIQFVRTDEELWLTVNESVSESSDADRELDRILSTLRSHLDPGPTPDSMTPPDVVHRTDEPDYETWTERVRTLLESLNTSGLHKLVLAQSRRLRFESAVPLPYLTSRLQTNESTTYRFLMESLDGAVFTGITPETLVRVSGDHVFTESLAGSARTGSSPRETIDEARDLMNSTKNRHEHDVVLESICSRLEPFLHQVRRRDRTVRTLRSVQHLATPVEGELHGPTHVLELVDALHPTPAVGGVPIPRALDLIRQHEPFGRGFYGGPIGWFNGEGDGCFAVGIRSARVRDRRATLFAGAGIVADSDPDSEWEELQWKYRTVLQLLGDPTFHHSP